MTVLRRSRADDAPTPGIGLAADEALELDDDLTTDPPPHWLGMAGDVRDDDKALFYAGVALASLHPVAAGRRGRVPLGVLRQRLALEAALACLRRRGRPERAETLRDTVHLARPGDALGPVGDVYMLWRERVSRLLVPDERPGVGECGREAPATPIARAAEALAATLDARPDDVTAALIAAEIALAQALGWPRPLPLIATSLAPGDLALRGSELEGALARTVAAGARRAIALARDLERRAGRLRAVAPALRAGAAPAAVALFLAEDALSPTVALSPVVCGTSIPMSSRAARRLCERLEALGAIRELTGRTSFRLYGL